MKRTLYLIFLVLLLNNCSFDNKTGIWTGSKNVSKKKDVKDSNIELIFKKQNEIIKDKELPLKQNLNLERPIIFTDWNQSYQNKSNYIGNVSFFNEGNYKKFSNISKSKVNKNILVNKDNLFFSDIKGNIGVFSLTDNKLIYKFNFYKKKFKKTKIIIKLIIEDESIIAADNLGYVYSINLREKKLNWAKNFLVPFRSNLKIINKTLYLSDEKNKITLIDIQTGRKVDEFYTQPPKAVSKFESNLALDSNGNLLFLSTNGSLYSLNLRNQKTLNWIQNFKPENEIIFKGKPITLFNGLIIVSSEKGISMLSENGKKIWDLSIESNISPIISGNTIITITKDNYLLLIDKENGEIIYSKNIYLLIKNDFKKNLNRKINTIENIFFVNNKLLLISNNSYFIEINLQNNLNVNSIKKNPFDISSNIVFLKNKMIFVSNSKKVYTVN